MCVDDDPYREMHALVSVAEVVSQQDTEVDG